MKKLRKIILILLGIDVLAYIIIKLFNVHMTTVYGNCVRNICTDSAHTHGWAVAAYASLGGLFIITIILWLIFTVRYVLARRKYRKQNKR